MQRTSVLIALLAGLALAVPSASNPGFESQVGPRLSAPSDGVTDDAIAPTGTSRIVENGDVDCTSFGEGPGGAMQTVDDQTASVPPYMDWGDDILIATLNDQPTRGKIATDVEEDGTIWAAIWDPDNGSPNDTIFHYYSTDGGEHWTFWNVITGASGTGDIRDFDMRVGTVSGNTRVYTFVVFEDGGYGVYVRYWEPGGSGNWVQIAAGDTWAEVSADRNIETPQHVFCGFASQSGALKLESSNDGCQSFANHRSVASGIRQPAVCAGGAGYVYIAYLYRVDSARCRVGRYTNNLISPTFIFNNVDSLANNRFEDISIAAARTSPGASQTAIILNTYRRVDNGNHGPRYGWTTDGGQTWDATFWPPQQSYRSTWLTHSPYIRVGYGEEDYFRGLCVFPETTTSFDSICYSYANNLTPTNWQARAIPNDYRATGEFGPVVDWSADVYSGGYVIYREFGSRHIWVDGWNYPSAAEGGKPVQPGELRTATFLARDGAINLSLPGAARVSAVLYDGAGRKVREVFSGSLDAGQHRLPVGELAHGLYFIHLDINGSTHTAKLVSIN